MPEHNSDQPTARGGEDDASRLLAAVRELAAEIHRQPVAEQSVDLDSALDRDLGLDSLARVELVSRVEKRFGVALPERVYAEAQTPRDLLLAVQRADASTGQTVSRAPAAPSAGDATPAPASAGTLIDVLEWHVANHPDRTHIHLYNDDGGEEEITYHGLWERAQSIASGLQNLGLEAGEPVVLMLQTGGDYFGCFFGVLLSGGVPVPIYPPARPSQIEDHIRRQQGILKNCRASTLITMPEATHIARLLKSQADTLRHVVTAAQLEGETTATERPARGPDDTAFLQYTSGSTGNPKGVVLTHANLLANIRTMGSHIRASPDDVFVSWLPLYHDMGLIGAWLGSLYYAATFVVMSPLAFIARPQRWLQALHRHRGTLSASPNFGYELCVRRIDEAELKDLDLSAWRIAFNGAEPISPETLQRFYDRFSHYGLRREAITPVYGLAESSVGLSFPPLGRGPVIDRVQRPPFMEQRHAVPARQDDPSALSFVGCGRVIAGHEIRIVDATNRELPERHEGRLQFRGPSTTSGYYRNPEATRRLFHGDWLESGDLAYIADGELFLTGRSKDIIIRAGRNLYPHELEEAAGNIAGVRPGRVAAFASKDPDSGTERLIVVAETRERNEGEHRRLREEINAAISDLTGDPPDDIVLAPPGTVLKTPSGKIRRAACRDLYETGLIGRRGRSVWWQLTRLGAAGLWPQLRRSASVARAILYGVYAHALFWPTALLVWATVIVTPGRGLRWRVMRTASRALVMALGIRVEVRNHEALPDAETSCIIVSNHASYIDGALLVLALARPVSFVAKAELGSNPLIGLFLRRIDAEFVERFDVERGLEDARRLARDARGGRALLFFPEGTFTRAPGLLPFRMGAFVAAAESQVPVVPVAIRGSRAILRSESWWPSPGAVTVSIGTPVTHEPSGEGESDAWETAVALRDAAREAIRRHTGEPDMIERSPLQGKTGGVRREA